MANNKTALAKKLPFINNKSSIFQNEIKRNFQLFLFLVPGTLYLLIFAYLPMPGALIAFKDYKVRGSNIFENFITSSWVGLKNFRFLFSTPDAFRITRNVILYNFTWLLLGLVASVFIAIAINEISNRRLAKFYQTSFFLPYFLSWIIVGYLVYSLLNGDYGILNTILKALGKEPVMWYMEPIYWPFILTFANLWKYSGYNSIIYIAAITSFDNELYEAASIDGASKWQQISKITIPLLTPLMVILSILAVGRIFYADFGLFYTLPMNSGTLKPVTDVIDVYVFISLRDNFNIALSSAAGLYQSAVGFVLVLVTNLIVRRINSDYSLF